nr:MAG TPA: hypothetical protein [Herelleviridae sp.]
MPFPFLLLLTQVGLYHNLDNCDKNGKMEKRKRVHHYNIFGIKGRYCCYRE